MILQKNIEIIRDSQFKPVSSKQDLQDGQEGFLKIDRMNKICRMDRIIILLSCNPVHCQPTAKPKQSIL